MKVIIEKKKMAGLSVAGQRVSTAPNQPPTNWTLDLIMLTVPESSTHQQLGVAVGVLAVAVHELLEEELRVAVGHGVAAAVAAAILMPRETTMRRTVAAEKSGGGDRQQ